MTEENVNQEELEEVSNEEVSEEVVEPSYGGDEGSGEGDGEPAEVKAEPAYEPNYHYKVNGEEKEFPEWMRSQIVDEETEKQARDMMERADGLFHVKEHRDRLTKEIEEQYKPQMEILHTANNYLQQGDLQGFFEYSGLKDEDIFQYALKRLELKEDPAREAAYNQQRQFQMENRHLQSQVQTLQQQQNQQLAMQRQMELDSFIGRPENLSIAQAYDEQVGKPGAFRSEIIRRGQYYAQMENRDASVEDLFSEVSAPIRNFVGSQQPRNSGMHVTASGVVVGGGNQRQKETLPNIQKQGGSPVRKVSYKNINDLKKRAREIGAL